MQATNSHATLLPPQQRSLFTLTAGSKHGDTGDIKDLDGDGDDDDDDDKHHTPLTMNGMRRFLGGGSQRGQPQQPTNGSPPAPEPPLPPLPPLQTTAPLVISKPSWPPTPITASQGLPATAKQDQSQNKLRDSSSSNTISYGAQQSYNKRSSDDTASSPSRPHSAHSSPSRKPVPMSPTSVASSTTMSGRAPNAIAGPSSPPRPLPNRVAQLSHKAVIALDPSWKRSSHMVDTRDELLMSLLASEAIVDSHDCAILTSDEVEELKKVCCIFLFKGRCLISV